MSGPAVAGEALVRPAMCSTPRRALLTLSASAFRNLVRRKPSPSRRTHRRGFGDRIGEEEGLTIAKSQSSLDFETIAQEVSGLGQRVSDLETRLEHVEKVNTGLEEAALTTARALQEISAHWDKVYEAIRRRETMQ